MTERAIHKYTIAVADEQLVWMPRGAEVMSAHAQHGQICVWAAHTVPPKELVGHTFYVHGTGHVFDHGNESLHFIGTVHLFEGSLVLHVFMRTD